MMVTRLYCTSRIRNSQFLFWRLHPTLDIAAIDLLNSDWDDYRRSGRTRGPESSRASGSGPGCCADRVDDPEWVAAFMARLGFDPSGVPAEDVRAALKDLRALLRRIVEVASEGGKPDPADIRQMNRVLAGAPSVRRLVHRDAGFALESEPLRKNLAWICAEIALGLAEMLADGNASRLKVCQNPHCRWVFYDESKNRSRRWCDDSCGNLMKVRRFRERRRRART